jgi:hypothetical protein
MNVAGEKANAGDGGRVRLCADWGDRPSEFDGAGRDDH